MTPITRCVGTRLLAVLLVLSAAALARADVTYSLINYPEQQAGSTLSGTITVVDTAANDGVLQAGEVVRMRFTITNGPKTTTVDSATTPFAQLIVDGNVLIDAASIRIPRATSQLETNMLALRAIPPPGSFDDGEMWWERIGQVGGNSFDNHRAADRQGTATGGDDVFYWSISPASCPTSSFGCIGTWVIAEPPTGACCNRATGGCVVLTQADCTAFGGTYAGDNITCAAAPCTLCLGDLNGDGVVNTADLTRFLGRFGSTCQ